ncbi:uroporphyrinogen decarboxylase, putative [Ichthyophthirius multifiliis]|uniref:Uroporphyrinogen decarboxylase n=1 Tax=Ichthyophthirius multifiliis TaxID=5932 RepID=G0QLQ0_ICHMU|nr:uroporphyrinogen decarboxylase, putative [Ichthyophthirius multifiliis]EGR33846.1 uroporphyrinogen decarboxylase, putative [Ichthyophthirius multifiliis]|eukprot:XP_004039070.1 uroporphyrinogen decarboxylase, putative [Ichthyophthirius multifiliis]
MFNQLQHQEIHQKEIKLPLLSQTLKNLNIDPHDPNWRQNLREKRQNKVPQFPPMQNSTLLNVFKNEQISHLPIWVMRQAGRYLPEFRQIRQDWSFFDLCDNPLLATEVTLQPLQRFEMDAGIIFSDILVVPKVMGMEVVMEEKKGPVLPQPLLDPSHLERLKIPNIEDLGDVYDAIYLFRQAVDGTVSTIGFAGAPWTLMCYMIEGSGSKLYSKVKKWIYKWPQESKQLLQMITDVLIDYLSSQIESGAQVVQIFDSWAGELSTQDYQEFGLQYCVQIGNNLKEKHPDCNIIIFAKGQHSELVFQQKCFDCIGVDYAFDLEKAVQYGKQYNKIIQGNLDPGVLMGNKETIVQKTRDMIDKVGVNKYIVNLGHGMWPEHDLNNLKIFVDETHEYSKKLIQKQKNQ